MALHVPQLLLQPGVLLLFLQQPPLHGAQLLLGLILDVIGHHHRRLEVRLEAPPFLCLLLKMPEATPVSEAFWGGPAKGPLVATAAVPSHHREKDQHGWEGHSRVIGVYPDTERLAGFCHLPT